MKIFLSTLFLFSIYLLSNCKTQKTPETTKGVRIYFGSGGGFTGFVNEYCLLKNGTIFNKRTNEPKWIYHSKLDKKSMQQYFEQIEKYSLFETEFNHPSNRYFFIRVQNEEKENQITWGDTSKKPDSKIVAFYSILNNHILQKNANSSK